MFGIFGDFPKFGQILKGFEANLALWQIVNFVETWAVLANLDALGHFGKYMAVLGQLGHFWTVWHFFL